MSIRLKLLSLGFTIVFCILVILTIALFGYCPSCDVALKSQSQNQSQNQNNVSVTETDTKTI
jgi:biopolymer transport protein ExbD